MVAQPAEARHDGASRRPASDAMCRPSLGVVLEVGEVHQRRLGEVVVGELEVADLGRDTACVHADSDESRTVIAS